MLKAPILSREMFYAKNLDGSFRLLDWNLVNTSIGAMAEPRVVCYDDFDVKAAFVEQDVIDQSFTKLSLVEESTLYGLLGTYGLQIPINYNDPS